MAFSFPGNQACKSGEFRLQLRGLSLCHKHERRKKEQISKLLGRIKFVFIPALKSPSVLNYVLNLMSDYEVFDERKLVELNEAINERTKDLDKLMRLVGFDFSTKLLLPTDMNEFWLKLDVDTQWDASKINVPLNMHGEGIKSKYIPNLLFWLQQHGSYEYIWAIDEPENSLEYQQSHDQAQVYANNYGKKIQILLTTHSLSFIQAAEINEQMLYRVVLDDDSTRVIDVRGDVSKLEGDLGYYHLQQRFANEFSKEIENLREEQKKDKELLITIEGKLQKETTTIVITEGKTDWAHMKNAFSILDLSENFRFLEFDESMGDTELDKICDSIRRTETTKKVIHIFDRDNPKIVSKHSSRGKRYVKHSDFVYSFCIPAISIRTHYENLSIEFYYPDSVLLKKYFNKRIHFDTEIRKCIEQDMFDRKNSTTRYKVEPEDPVNIQKRKVFDTDVDKITDDEGNILALSKTFFLRSILKDSGLVPSDFEQFREIHSVIQEIIEG